MSAFKLFKLLPDDVTKAELIASAATEHGLARQVFKMWPVARCLPFKQWDSVNGVAASVLTIWETTEDAKKKRTPVAIVRTQPSDRGFKQKFWIAPVSA